MNLGNLDHLLSNHCSGNLRKELLLSCAACTCVGSSSAQRLPRPRPLAPGTGKPAHRPLNDTPAPVNSTSVHYAVHLLLHLPHHLSFGDLFHEVHILDLRNLRTFQTAAADRQKLTFKSQERSASSIRSCIKTWGTSTIFSVT